MKLRVFICTLAFIAFVGASRADAQISSSIINDFTIGGEHVATLFRPYDQNSAHPQFLEAEFLPGRGMNLIQIKAYVPGKGVISLLASPSLEDAKNTLEASDPYGNEAFKLGGAFLLPYANRIRGTLSADGRSIDSNVAGHSISLPANWKGNHPGAEVHSMHGLILTAKFQDVVLHNPILDAQHAMNAEKSTLSAVLHAGDFGGHWPSQTDVKIEAELTNDLLDLSVTATNIGRELLPMAIGMHPYFAFPSGNRTQARIRMPATMRAPANVDNFPFGTILPVNATRFDFTSENGAPLNSEFYDDCFTELQRNLEGNVEVRITDPSAKYGIKIIAISKEIKAIQMYAPPAKNYVAIEPQYNLSDPFNAKLWGVHDTGVVYLNPGESTTWHVQFAIYGLN